MIIDASALVAFVSRKDQWHEASIPVFHYAEEPFVTCEPVLTECCFLLPSQRQEIFKLVEDGLVRFEFSLSEEISSVRRLVTKYESLPMSLADACLVRMSELLRLPIFTFDSDFQIYRKNGRETIELVGIE